MEGTPWTYPPPQKGPSTFKYLLDHRKTPDICDFFNVLDKYNFVMKSKCFSCFYSLWSRSASGGGGYTSYWNVFLFAHLNTEPGADAGLPLGGGANPPGEGANIQIFPKTA